MASPPVSDYRLPAILVARMVGAALVALALLLLGSTVVVALSGWSPDVLVVAVLVGVVALGALAWWLRHRAYVVRLDAEGYRVGLVRGVGVRSAPWTAVTDAATTTVDGMALLVLSLRDGTTTTVPVSAMEGDRDDFVRELQRRLQVGHGVRPVVPPDVPPVPTPEEGRSLRPGDGSDS